MDAFINKLPDEFTFGVATASYQIEGASFGGCGRSHWDDFADRPGAVVNGENGSIACDHYHLWESDLDLIKNGGFDAYRFSFSWPRLMPGDDIPLNQEGIDFYDRLIDGMLARGLKPFATLYHWDLPSRHASDGGWQRRETAEYFADYTDVIMRHFGDRLYSVAPVNEPWCVSWLSHYWGNHAPGLQSLPATAKAMHIIQLAHGLSIEVMRGHGHKNLGCVLNKEYAVPGDDTEKTASLTALYDGIYNRWFEESIFKGRYPQEVLDVFGEHIPKGYEDDLKLISQPLDWVGMNYYTRAVIMPDDNEPHIGFTCTRGDLPKTDMGWEIIPEGLSFFLRRLANDYAPGLPLYVTENGMANPDRVVAGVVDDPERIAFYNAHLDQIIALAEEGVNVAGYFAWSLLDNFEWAYGYDKRFGIVHVDYDTMQRTPKASYYEWQKMLSS
jgi:beta-glucosidase